MNNQIENWMNRLINLYLILLVAGLPLFMGDHYFELGEYKWKFYKAISFGFQFSEIWIPGVLILLLFLFIFLPEKEKKDLIFSVPERFLMLYLISVVISSIFSLDPSSSISGYDGWHMGLLSQVSFAFIYYFISHFWKPNPWIFWIAEIVSSFVFFLVIINRFWLYPFNIAGDVNPYQLYRYVSTLGNIDWFAGYFTAIFPVGLIRFLKRSNSEIERIFHSSYVFIGGMCAAMLDAESAILGLAAILLISFYLIVRNGRQAKQYLYALILIFLSWGISGILQTVFQSHVMTLGFLSSLLTRSVLPWILIAGSVVLLAAIGQKSEVSKVLISFFRKLIMAGLIILAAYVILNSTGLLPDSLSTENEYLLLNEEWGHGRGILFSLTCTMLVSILRQAPWRIIVGVGPDQLVKGFQKYAPEAYWTKWTGEPIQNAHNELLNHLAVFGLAGMITYYGFLISSVIRYTKEDSEFCQITVLSAGASMIHGLVSFQQVLSTSLVFALIGMAEAFFLQTKKDKKSA